MAETKGRGKKSAGPTTDGEAAGSGAKTPPAAPHVCPVAFCPIGMALTSVQQAGPDVLDHLLTAAREFLLAARAVVDARASDFEDATGGRRLERIEIG